MKAIAMLAELFIGTGIIVDIVVGCDEKSDADFRYDAVAFFSGITIRNGSFFMEHCEIEDWPDCSFRSVMIDPARLYIPMDKVFTTIRQAALSKMNRFNMHLCDSGRYAIESIKAPELNHQQLRRYTIGEIRQIIGYADLIGRTPCFGLQLNLIL